MKKTLENIYVASLRFLEPLSLDRTCEIVVKEAMKLVDAEFGSIFLSNKGQLKRYYTTSQYFEKIIPRKNGHVYTTFRSNKASVIQVKDLKGAHPQLKEIGIGSIILIPLSYKDKSIGVLTVQSFQNQQFSEKELNILRLYGSLASMAIKKNQLYNDAQKAIELRDLFMAMASHELRTPLTVISGYIQMLHKRLQGTDSIEATWVNKLHVENSRLTNLVKELLEVNRIRSGQIQYFWTELSIKEICDKALQQFKLHFPDRNISFENKLNGNTSIVGDKEKLVQMVLSILDNAVKFSDPNSQVLLGLESKNSNYYITITDEGMGISKQEIERIFESFYRDVVNKKEGIGIGLYLVKNIVEQHHGTITIKSKISKGTKVTIKLPNVKTQ